MNINDILKNQLDVIKPSAQEILDISNKTKEVTDFLKKNIKKNKIKADVFVGGSMAKNTLIKKKKYDVDIFIRFDEKYDEEDMKRFLKKIVGKAKVIHGSRDYYSINKQCIDFEIVPSIKIKNPGNAVNITDLSYFHVNYVEKAIGRNKKLSDEIRLAKGFAYYQDCYGAESYINGFSGYALELLIIHYKSFVNFIKAMSKIKSKLIIDISKKYKGKDVLKELNEAKIQGPIIVVDPTYKERNATAALSYKTFLKFQKACKSFLKNPSSKFFSLENKEKKFEDIDKVIVKTNKQSGDIAGTKLKKFSNYFLEEAWKLFDIKKKDFDYKEDENKGIIFIDARPKKEIIFNGPPVKMKEALKKFRKEHKKIVIKKGRAYAIEKNQMDFKKFIRKFLKDKKKIIESMGINEVYLQ